MKKLLKWTSLNKVLLLILIVLILCVGCNHPSRDMSRHKDRDTSKNTVIYETFDDGNCQGGVCPPPDEYE